MAPRRQAAKSKTIRTRISRSQVPTIACINEATVDLEVDFDDLIAALQKFVDRDFAPIWGTPAKLVKAKKEIAGAWTMIFLDNADKARSLGHHKLTKDNLPSAK